MAEYGLLREGEKSADPERRRAIAKEFENEYASFIREFTELSKAIKQDGDQQMNNASPREREEYKSFWQKVSFGAIQYDELFVSF